MKYIRRLINLFKKSSPESLQCEIDGWEMKFVSHEIGYSCNNPVCPLHVHKESV